MLQLSFRCQAVNPTSKAECRHTGVATATTRPNADTMRGSKRQHTAEHKQCTLCGKLQTVPASPPNRVHAPGEICRLKHHIKTYPDAGLETLADLNIAPNNWSSAETNN